VRVLLPKLIVIVIAYLVIGCAPIEYSVIIVEASQAVAEAEIAGASCTQEQLDSLSPVTKNLAPDPGTALASSEEELEQIEIGQPRCDAPFEYYSAQEYLRKAREEVGYSDYEAAVEFAREARTYARKARDIALNRDQERGR
jgi:ABC-type molybdate transport system substrate-binding protein